MCRKLLVRRRVLACSLAEIGLKLRSLNIITTLIIFAAVRLMLQCGFSLYNEENPYRLNEVGCGFIFAGAARKNEPTIPSLLR
jgi:hypothetical protein